MAHVSNAATITVQETLNLLDGPFKALAAGVAEDRYAFWLGSGISFGRVAGLRQIVPKVLEFLRTQIDFATADCRFRTALNDALALAALSADEWIRVDFSRPFAEWPDAEAITARLINNYARLLDVHVEGEESDYLLWNGVDIAQTFANTAIDPDVEHLCIALLILEGTVSDVATANWDGLVERAATELMAGQPSIVVCVRPENLREPQRRAYLYKFHGCAIRAIADEANYRPFLIGRQSQINGWAATPEHAAVVNRLTDIIVTKPTLMMGLSAQDANIQALFARAAATMAWPWPGDRPSYVFSEEKVGADQQGMLQNVYRAAYTPATRQQILDSALIRAYAKPLLVALTLHVFCSKIRRLIDLAPSRLSPADRADLQAGVLALRNQISAAADDDRLAFVRSLINQVSRTIQLFRDGREGPVPRPYNPITTSPLHQIAADAAIPASGLREAAAAIGILGIGIRDGLWTLTDVDLADPASGVARITSTVSSAKIVFVANSHIALRLRHNGHVIDGEDVIIVHSAEIIPSASRSPRRAPGRTGKLTRREVSIGDLLANATDSRELLQNFRSEIAI